jgi:hypothetical protein
MLSECWLGTEGKEPRQQENRSPHQWYPKDFMAGSL